MLLRNIQLIIYVLLLCYLNKKSFIVTKVNEKKSPVILIPGIMMEYTSINLTEVMEELSSCLYPKTVKKIPFHVPGSRSYNCIAAYIRYFPKFFKYLEYSDGRYKNMSNEFGIISEETKNHSSILLPWVNTYFGRVVELLESMGYKRNYNIIGALYNWETIGGLHEMYHYFTELGNKIRRLYYIHDEKVVLLSQDLGSPLIRRFLSLSPKSWKDKYIKKWISIDGAFAGSVNVMYTARFGLPIRLNNNPATHTKAFQFAFGLFPTTYYMYPSKLILNQNRTILTTPSSNYTLANISKNYAHHFNLLESFLHQKYLSYHFKDIWITNSIDVPFYCVYSIGVKTPNKLSFTNSSNEPIIEFDPGNNGDGILTKEELDTCIDVARMNEIGYAKNTVLAYVGHEGGNLLSKSLVLGKIKDFLTES